MNAEVVRILTHIRASTLWEPIMKRRQFLPTVALGLATCGAVALPAVWRTAAAQTYPMRPARIVVGFAPGGQTDISARLIGQWLSARLGQQFIIENRPGASGNIATEVVVKAPPDGYTLLFVVSSNASNATLFDKLNFVFLRDIMPVGGLARFPFVTVVNPSFRAKTTPEFIAYAKANPGKLTVGTAGGTPQVAAELFKMVATVNLVLVPYRGDAPGLTDVMGGQVQMYLGGLSAAIELIKAGRLRALGVTTATRSEALPDTPALAEFVPGYEVSTWQGIGAPKDTSSEIIGILSKEINAALIDPRFKARLAELGGVPIPMKPAEFGKFLADETEKLGKVIRAANIRPE
jgi:tripartite-type tricarboxylate transporter receptor subunit TctC